MSKQGNLEVVLNLLRPVLLLLAGIAMAVGVLCFAFDLVSLEAYGTLLTWAGFAIFVLAAILGAGGLSSQMKDVADFSITGAGDMSENLRQIAEAKSSSLGCFIQLLCTGVGLLALGYIVQFIASMVL